MEIIIGIAIATAIFGVVGYIWGQRGRFLKQVDSLEEVWVDLINARVTSESEFNQWKTDYAEWKHNVLNLSASEPPRVVNINRRGTEFNAEHLSLLGEGNGLGAIIEAMANRLR